MTTGEGLDSLASAIFIVGIVFTLTWCNVQTKKQETAVKQIKQEVQINEKNN